MKNCYLVLKVNPDASPDEIRKAYKRLVKLRRPDSEGGDAERFKEIQAAYETLCNPGRRRKYNDEHLEPRRGALPSPPSVMDEESVDIGLDFGRYSPSLDSLLEFFLRRFKGEGGKSGSREHLRVEVILTRAEAARGGVLPLDVPVFTTCPRCDGSGGACDIVCSLCEGSGAMETRRRLPVRIPPGIPDGSALEHDLAGIGVPGAVLHVDVRVR